MEKVAKIKCATCPFRRGSPYANLQGMLAQSALTEGSRICHSTGESAIYGGTGKEPLVCRGSRDLQLKMFHTLGVIEDCTDETWEAAWMKLKANLKLQT